MKQQFKGEELTLRKCVNSIMRFYNLASHLEAQEGMNWYKEANTYSKELSARFGHSLSQIAGIIAVFSPQSGWAENKRYAVSFLTNPKNRVKSLCQTLKVKNICKLQDEAKIYNALSITGKAFKTKAFFLNILNYDIVTNVTIDRHAIAACIQNPSNVWALDESYGKLTKQQYEFFELAYVTAAGELGIMPQQLQAIVWTVYRRMRDLRQYSMKDAKQWQPFDNENYF